MTSYGENASFVSLLGGAPVAEGASDVSEPDVLKPKDASGHPEDSPPERPLCRCRAENLAFLTSSQVMLALLAPGPTL